MSTRDPSESDHALVMRARNGDRDAFSELVVRHQQRVWRVCRQYVGADEADATAQDTLVKAYTNLELFDGRSAFTTWLTRIAINTSLDELRRRRRQGRKLDVADDEEEQDVLAGVPDNAVGPLDRTMQRQAVDRLAVLERDLPERQREIFRLRFYAELELEEIAGTLGVHVGTVKTQLHRAVHRLRAELGDTR